MSAVTVHHLSIMQYSRHLDDLWMSLKPSILLYPSFLYTSDAHFKSDSLSCNPRILLLLLNLKNKQKWSATKLYTDSYTMEIIFTLWCESLIAYQYQ